MVRRSGSKDLGILKSVSRSILRFGIILVIATTCVTSVLAPAGADTTSFSSSTIGSSGDTPSFAQTGPWTMSWTYSDCSGGQGDFSVDVKQPSADTTEDIGPNESGTSATGTDFYYDTGTFSLDVNSTCTWTINVAPSSAAPLALPAAFASTKVGSSGDTQQFSVSGPWTMSWMYSDCSGGQGNFIVDVGQPSGDTNEDIGPNESGAGTSGTDSYTDTGTFSLDINSTCTWSITAALSAASTTTTTAASTTTTVLQATSTATSVPPTTATTSGAVVASSSSSNTSGSGSSLALTGTPTDIWWLVTFAGSMLLIGRAGRRLFLRRTRNSGDL